MTVAFYVTSHGFGHFVRAAEVMKSIPRELPLVLKTGIPEWFLRQELVGVNVHSFEDKFDCGTLGPDSTHVDAEMTFARAELMQADNEARLESEIAFLRDHNVRVVVSDVPSFPSRAAREAGIPSIVISNFTWVEIYARLAAKAMEERLDEWAELGLNLTEKLRAEYAMADLLLIPDMALDMGAAERQLSVPIIARRGVDRRELLCERLDLDPARPIYLLYLGQEGYQGIDWSRLEEIEDAQFVSFKPVQGRNAGAVHVLGEGVLAHIDATATADVVIGKLGYSLCAECVATRTPLVFPPRPDFIEAEALGRSMIQYGLGSPISAADFRELNWLAALARANELAASAPSIDCSGAEVCASIIEAVHRFGDVDQALNESLPPRLAAGSGS